MSKQRSIALVTGASAGLGAEFCRQLAGSCDAIIAVGRRRERLEQLRDELAGRAEVLPLVADLATEEGMTRGVEALRQQGPVDVLVNNAGFGVNGDFDTVSLERQQAMVDLHISATLRLSAAAIPFMRERGGGRIVNVSSVGAFLPAGGVAVYCASKAFLNVYSTALQQELESSGIRVQALCPGYVRTEFQSRPDIRDFDPDRIPDDRWLAPAAVVRDSLAALADGPVVFVPGEVYRGLCADSLQQQRERLLSV